jgi:hypothetical protein
MGMFTTGQYILEYSLFDLGHRRCHYRSGASENCFNIPTGSFLGSSDCTNGRLISYAAHLGEVEG